MTICRCEEVSKEDIVAAIRRGQAKTIEAVKRRTSAGMGLCQGRTCQRLIAQILKEETGVPLGDIKPSTVRPLPAHIFDRGAKLQRK